MSTSGNLAIGYKRGLRRRCQNEVSSPPSQVSSFSTRVLPVLENGGAQEIKVKVHRFQSWHHMMCSPGRQPGSPNPPSLPPHSDSSHFIASLVESNSQIPGQASISRPNECRARALTTMPLSIDYWKLTQKNSYPRLLSWDIFISPDAVSVI